MIRGYAKGVEFMAKKGLSKSRKQDIAVIIMGLGLVLLAMILK